MTTTVTIPTLQTGRLTLRAPRLEDFETFAAFRAGPRSAHVGGPNTREEAFQQLCALIGHWHIRGYGRWILTETGRDAPLGVAGLFYPEGWPEPEIGWSLFDGAEGKGFATEAALAARAYAYDTLGWSTVISAVRPDNTRSAALARRIGAVHEREFDHETLGPLQIWRHPSPQEAA